jgi:glutathione S-transferase
MGRIILYISPKSPVSQVTMWMCRSIELSFDERVVNREEDMQEILERNPNRILPVLQDDELFLTEGTVVMKYLYRVAKDNGGSGKWPGLAGGLSTKEEACIDDCLGYVQSDVKPAIQEYITSLQSAAFDTVPDSSKYVKLQSILANLDRRKKGKQFIASNHLTVADLYIFATIVTVCGRTDHSWDNLGRLEGWFRVVRKILNNEWPTEKACLDCYESDSEEEDYMLAETVMDCVKNDRPDVLDQIAKDGGNINMPLAVVEAVNRGNLSILKVMQDHKCFMKWPMAISMAMRFPKGEEILALLFGPGQTPEERKQEATEIMKDEARRARVALGLPPDPTEEEIHKYRMSQENSKAPNTVGGSVIGQEAVPPVAPVVPVVPE